MTGFSTRALNTDPLRLFAVESSSLSRTVSRLPAGMTTLFCAHVVPGARASASIRDRQYVAMCPPHTAGIAIDLRIRSREPGWHGALVQRTSWFERDADEAASGGRDPYRVDCLALGVSKRQGRPPAPA